MRTKGPFDLDGRLVRTREGGYAICDFATDPEKAGAGYYRIDVANAEHWLACAEAIEAIGGEPATVGELAGALRDILDMHWDWSMGDYTKVRGVPNDSYAPDLRTNECAMCREHARALLAKLEPKK